MEKTLKITIILLILITLSCKKSNENTTSSDNKTKKIDVKKSGELIPIDLTDKKYLNLISTFNDTITKNGWKIEYLVKEDKTKYKDLYIKWSKGKKVGIFKADSAIIDKNLIPKFAEENINHLFFTHHKNNFLGVLILPKDTKQNIKNYTSTIGYNSLYGKIIVLPENNNNSYVLKFLVIDSNSGIEKPIIFENYCAMSNKIFCFDKVVVDKNSVEITATLIDKNDKLRKRSIVERRKVNFN
jgi:hypothetical protein